MNKAQRLINSLLNEQDDVGDVQTQLNDIKDMSARIQTLFNDISNTASDSELKALAFKYQTQLKDMDTAINNIAGKMSMSVDEPETIDTEMQFYFTERIMKTSIKARKLVEQVVNGKRKSLTEIIAKTDNCGSTRFSTEDSAKYREIVESYFQQMTEALEQAGLKSFEASVNDTYASVSYGRGCY